MILEQIAYAVVGLFLYLLPTAMAFHRGHPNRTAIAAINVGLGWTFVGWWVALAMVLWQQGAKDAA